MDKDLVIKKTSKVTSVFNVKSDITLENLFNILSSTDSYFRDIPDYIDEMIDEINENGESWYDKFCVGVNENILYCDGGNGFFAEDLLAILVKIFDEAFVALEREDFWLDVKDYEGETFVYTNITDSENNDLVRIFTRNDRYFYLNPLTTENIIPPDKQKSIMEYYYDHDKVLSDAKKMQLFMKKKYFDPKKWWLGWTCEHD